MKKSKNRVSCIIPAYNEAQRIGRVLSVLKDHPLLSEILVVDDASTDATAQVVGQFPFVTLLSLSHNYGKAYSVWYAATKAQSPIIVLLDADLIDLKPEHVTRLIKPVLEGIVDATMSIRRFSSLLDTFVDWCKVDPFTGDRCLSKKLLLSLPITKQTPGYALEVIINEYLLAHHVRIGVVDFRDVRCVYKMHKVGFLQGVIGDITATKNVFSIISVRRLFYQYKHLIARKIYFPGNL